MSHTDTRKRYQEIGRVLARHGFEWLWTKWGIGAVLGNFERHRGEGPSLPRTEPEKFRLTLEELGTTFIKLGQMLSTRPDLLPAEYISELSKLQDNAPKVPLDKIDATILAEFGRPPEVLFGSFDSEPRAAGSVAQVHGAQLPDGTPVVVKVRRPGIELQVEQDLAILSQIARFLTHNTEIGKSYDVAGLVDEFGFTLRNELDFVREGQNAERIAAEFADDPKVHVPKIYWDFTTHGVLTMEDIRGIKIDNLAALDAAGIDRKELAKRCAHIALVQVLDQGFFHADPHPGNFFVQADGVVALIDFGMVGHIGERLRAGLLRLSLAVSRRDTERLVDELLAMGAAKGSIDRAALGRALDHFLAQYDGLPLGSVSAAKVFREVTSIVQRHGLTLPSDLVVLARVVAMDEGMGASLDPKFNLVAFSQPYLKRFWVKHHSITATAQRIREGAYDFADILDELPERIVRLSGMLERGELTVTSRVEGSEELTKKIQQATNRISISVLTAGMIVGLSVMAQIYRTPGAGGFDYFLLRALFAAAVISGGWLLVAFWKSNSR